MRLAIVIPTLDEETTLAENLAAARQLADLLIVADGGSTDRSLALAAQHGAQVVHTGAGRGRQLNAGARAALAQEATVLLFLHADTRLPANARYLVESSQQQEAVGGGFPIRFDDPRVIFKLGAAIVNLRTRFLRLPLGDQAQFVTAVVFRELGGFQNWPILEDLDFIRRLRRRGRLCIPQQPVTTAARRFTERGIARTIGTNWLIWALFLAGVEPRRLARLYPQIR